MMSEKPEISSTGVYLVLLVLLVVTVGAAFLHLGVGNVIISLVVATLQMAFIAVYFMQLRFSSHLTWIVAGASLLWLGILFALVMGDYATRSWRW
jgi:cytochrome c oxidase subunit 4